MIKLAFGTKEYWVGYNKKLGYLIFDPLVQNAESPDQVRLFVLNRNRSSSFMKEIIRNNLAPDASLDVGHCQRITGPYAKARANLRAAHCYLCGKDLSTTDFGICDKCGWIQCSCGACGCGYRKT